METDSIFVVRQDGTAMKQIVRCEAYTLKGERCSRTPAWDYDGLELCFQHWEIARRPPRVDYWQFRKDSTAWRERKRKAAV